MNLNKKTGERNPIFELVRITGDAEKLFSSVPLTRRLLGGKISKFFNLCGFFEPVRLLMKLFAGSLKGKEWDEILLKEDQVIWRRP